VFEASANPDMVADLSHWHVDTFELTWRRRSRGSAVGRAQFVLDHDAGVRN